MSLDKHCLSVQVSGSQASVLSVEDSNAALVIKLRSFTVNQTKMFTCVRVELNSQLCAWAQSLLKERRHGKTSESSSVRARPKDFTYTLNKLPRDLQNTTVCFHSNRTVLITNLRLYDVCVCVCLEKQWEIMIHHIYILERDTKQPDCTACTLKGSSGRQSSFWWNA